MMACQAVRGVLSLNQSLGQGNISSNLERIHLLQTRNPIGAIKPVLSLRGHLEALGITVAPNP